MLDRYIDTYVDEPLLLDVLWLVSFNSVPYHPDIQLTKKDHASVPLGGFEVPVDHLYGMQLVLVLKELHRYISGNVILLGGQVHQTVGGTGSRIVPVSAASLITMEPTVSNPPSAMRVKVVTAPVIM